MTKHICPSIFILSLALRAFAQMNAQYDTYTTWDYNPATSLVTQTVVVEGLSTGSCNGIPGCSSATHIPYIANKLNQDAFNGNPSSPDWIHGTPTNPFQYLTMQNSVSAVVHPGQPIPTWDGALVFCTFLNGPMFYDLLKKRVQVGTDFIWYDEPIALETMTNKCAWAVADSVQCHSVCRAIEDPIVAKCYDGQTIFRSMLDEVPWMEIDTGFNIIGFGLNGSTFEKKQGSAGPAAACSAIPAHWGSW